MAAEGRTALKTYFNTGDTPTEAQFVNLIDSGLNTTDDTLDNITAGSTNVHFTTTDESKLDAIEASADVTDATNVGTAMTGATAKTTPVDADTMPLNDSAASNVLKKVTWANVKATLKSYTDTLYAALGHTHTESEITDLGTYLTDITGENIADLSDVTVTTPADNEVLAYNTGTSTWINQTASEAGLAAASHSHATSDVTSGTFDNARIAESNVTQHQAALSITESQISDLDHDAVKIQGVGIDATVGTPSDGDILVYRSAGTDWVLEAKPAGGSNPAMSDITDVTITTVADNEVMAYDNGTSTWINQTAAEAGLAAASHTHTESEITDLGAYITASSTDTLTNKTLTSPKVAAYDGIYTGSAKVLELGSYGTPVNYVLLEAGETGGAAVVASAGSDTNVDLSLVAKGSGVVKVGSNAVIDAGDTATTTTAGIVELATGAEVNTGTDTTRAVTPDALDDWTGSAQITTVGTLSAGNADAAVSASSTTTAGKIEIATSAETTTGTDATRAVSPDGLAGSDYGKRHIGILVFSDADDTAVADGAGDVFVRIPSTMNGWNLVDVEACVQTAGTTGTTDIQIHNVTQAADMLSTKITIDSAETDSSTAATAPVIDTANDDVATGDQIRIDVDAVSTTAAKGLFVELTFQKP